MSIQNMFQIVQALRQLARALDKPVEELTFELHDDDVQIHFNDPLAGEIDTVLEGNDRSPEEFPPVVCLCGSTRFFDAFSEANFQETLEGRIVLSVGFYPHADWEQRIHGEVVGVTPEQKKALDELHKRKIDLADEVLVLNVDGYVGESTASEVAYALAHSKFVRFWESDPGREWLREHDLLRAHERITDRRFGLHREGV
jgi:hypothetical protein